MINYVGLKSFPNEGWGYYKKKLFTLTYGDDTVYYHGNLDEPDIYSYEVSDGKLYIYSNSDFEQYNLVDGVYSGLMEDLEFELEIKGGRITLFKVAGVTSGNIHDVSLGYGDNYIRISAFIPVYDNGVAVS